MKLSFSHSFNRFLGALPRGFTAGFVVLAALLADIHPAAAQVFATTLGDMICNSQFNMGPYGNLFSVVAYCAGAAFVGQGLHLLVRYSDNPNGMRLSEPMTRLVGGAGLLAAPSVASAVVWTFFGYNSGGGLAGCAAGAVAPAAGGIGLDTILTNIVSNIYVPMNMMVSTAAVVIGFFMVVRGLMKASKYGADPRENSMPRILSNLLVGSLLIVAGQDFDVILNSLFGSGIGSATPGSVVVGWNFIQQLNASAQFITAVQSAGYFMELVGMIAFVRGWMILKGASEGSGQATLAQGITHILGGVLAMNIFGFLEIMDGTFGTNFLSPA